MSLPPPQPKELGSPSLSPSPRRSNSSTPKPRRASRRAGFCGPPRPGNAITAAPLREGTYQPFSSSASLVLNDTRSCAAPSSATGTYARATRVAASACVGQASRAPQEHRAERAQREPRGDAQQAAEVITGRACVVRVVERLAAGDQSEESDHERKCGL